MDVDNGVVEDDREVAEEEPPGNVVELLTLVEVAVALVAVSVADAFPVELVSVGLVGGVVEEEVAAVSEVDEVVVVVVEAIVEVEVEVADVSVAAAVEESEVEEEASVSEVEDGDEDSAAEVEDDGPRTGEDVGKAVPDESSVVETDDMADGEMNGSGERREKEKRERGRRRMEGGKSTSGLARHYPRQITVSVAGPSARVPRPRRTAIRRACAHLEGLVDRRRGGLHRGSSWPSRRWR